MDWQVNPLLMLTGIGLTCAPLVAQSKIYVTVEQVQQIIFPNQKMTAVPMLIADDLQKKMKSISGVSEPFSGNRIYKVANGSWLIVDEVVGKHEMITYAMGISAAGTVVGVEIMEYRESYGYQVADLSWRRQFHGKSAVDPIKLNQDIQNISGATLSSKHLTDGIKRVLVFYDHALRDQQKK
jgi:Na+-translocating ferredoxin:NAD+ oxidoreductase RnfG subunit